MSTEIFARAQTYTAASAAGVCKEAARHPDYISHIQNHEPPMWRIGSAEAVTQALEKYLATPAPVGKLLRKRRHDCRCLVAGVLSWPETMADLRSGTWDPAHKARFKKWHDDSIHWLQKQFGDKLVAVFVHTDESHPHMHFFVVGDANKLHPGLREEFVDGKRIESSDARFAAYKKGVSAWLQQYHQDVGAGCGLTHTPRAEPMQRIKDRGVYQQLKVLQQRIQVIDEALQVHPNPVIQRLRDDLRACGFDIAPGG